MPGGKGRRPTAAAAYQSCAAATMAEIAALAGSDSDASTTQPAAAKSTRRTKSGREVKEPPRSPSPPPEPSARSPAGSPAARRGTGSPRRAVVALSPTRAPSHAAAAGTASSARQPAGRLVQGPSSPIARGEAGGPGDRHGHHRGLPASAALARNGDGALAGRRALPQTERSSSGSAAAAHPPTSAPIGLGYHGGAAPAVPRGGTSGAAAAPAAPSATASDGGGDGRQAAAKLPKPSKAAARSRNMWEQGETIRFLQVVLRLVHAFLVSVLRREKNTNDSSGTSPQGLLRGSGRHRRTRPSANIAMWLATRRPCDRNGGRVFLFGFYFFEKPGF
jgi:hypothetical protein